MSAFASDFAAKITKNATGPSRVACSGTMVVGYILQFEISLDIAVDNCAICRNHIMDLCIDCQSTATSSSGIVDENILSQGVRFSSQDTQASQMSNPSSTPSDECVVAWGQCSHAFHNHCISRWLKTRKVCPLDNKEWIYAPQATVALNKAAN
ncbi:putative ring-box protein 1 [Mitosporidium daphniae]|uniref:Putative ring-box protein 1 n=1 Tax=Mitosporidium daphniae TaxID=1485682 RepID=A0A098VPC3_9MICR|nr:putative ring-box protein 1 [Mitosporidium daphniae]KGG50810.1 putative ring-box protein 1 [Mitosporidium daphniae]|eukprot:XP_013237255.1 putative ring-box protein 1 [Mitosporidium daphniae]